MHIQYCRGGYDITPEQDAEQDADEVRWWTRDGEVALSMRRLGDHEPWSVTSALPTIPEAMLDASYSDVESAFSEYARLTA